LDNQDHACVYFEIRCFGLDIHADYYVPYKTFPFQEHEIIWPWDITISIHRTPLDVIPKASKELLNGAGLLTPFPEARRIGGP
jgi:hypothetical protein